MSPIQRYHVKTYSFVERHRVYMAAPTIMGIATWTKRKEGSLRHRSIVARGGNWPPLFSPGYTCARGYFARRPYCTTGSRTLLAEAPPR